MINKYGNTALTRKRGSRSWPVLDPYPKHKTADLNKLNDSFALDQLMHHRAVYSTSFLPTISMQVLQWVIQFHWHFPYKAWASLQWRNHAQPLSRLTAFCFAPILYTRCQKNESSPNFWQNLAKSVSSEKYTCFSYLNMHIEIWNCLPHFLGEIFCNI